ncbi:MAG: Zn-dependent protease [Planctomycetes bacterium SCN 63-9]|nr:MAG: Zn-dependent protease [Planctomycetes bacterium SCN 63-9]
MRMSWKLGRIAGIDIYIHSTFLLLLFFPGMATAGLLLVLVFGCVLLHELGHALAARRFGIDTADITLYPIGGVARLNRIPKAPGAEFLIALAGPAVNFAIVLILLALGILFHALGVHGLIDELLDWLMIINLSLGLFNLIPAFPMDGGRILRAGLSGWLGRARATSIAATIGRTLALAFGIYCLFGWTLGSGEGEGPNFIQAALAAFIYLAGTAEERQVLAEERLHRFEGLRNDAGIWNAPPGYRWVQRGDGIWQLSPNLAAYPETHYRTAP